MSLVAGLFFGGVSAYGAYKITNDPHDYWTSLSKHHSCTPFTNTACISFIYHDCLRSSRRRCPDCSDGDEIQEIWEINACRNHGRTEVQLLLSNQL